MDGLRKDGILIPLMADISKTIASGALMLTVIFRDMSATRRAEADLLALVHDRDLQLQKVVAANRAKSQFLATMSHELRTPLNAIIGFSSLIENETFGPIRNQKYKGYIHDIHNSGRHLLSLINDILDLSRIESSKYDLEIRPIDPVDVMTEAAARLEPMVLEKAVAMVMPDAIPGCGVLGDSRAVLQILLNLIGNAVKFVGKGGRIQLQVQRRPEDGTVALVVSDNGRGIPADQLPSLGQPFVQAQNAHTRDQGGSGLGLAISKSLAKGMNGNVEVESEFGVGTTVRLVLPGTVFQR